MATTFKTLTANDIVNTRTLLHEAIPLTGTIASGTYSDLNIKTYTHGMFESTFDYPFLSSSANHIFDITHGYSNNSILSGTDSEGLRPQHAKKINIYNQMAAQLVGHSETGAILDFDQDGNIAAGGTKSTEVFFVNFARLLSKDEIKKGSFTMTFLTGGTPSDASPNPATNPIVLGDYNAATSYFVNSPAGEYGLLYSSSADANAEVHPQGFIYYQAGIAVVTGAIFSSGSTAAGELALLGTGDGASGSYSDIATSASIDVMALCLRNRLADISFNNTVELNSTIYFCRANNNEFNYSANPTYLNSSKLRVKNTTSDNPVSYITTVGLYSSDNELLAVAKLSEPLKKDPNTELTVRVRLDY